MADYGIKISRTGDVKTATILDQTFNSEKNCFKIALMGTATSNASGARLVQVTHSLTIVPTFLCFFDYGANGTWFSNNTIEDISGKNVTLRSASDATYLNLNISSDDTKSVRVYYLLFVDPGGIS
jgi:hypothetical protein